jgi:hypothetical protein
VRTSFRFENYGSWEVCEVDFLLISRDLIRERCFCGSAVMGEL